MMSKKKSLTWVILWWILLQFLLEVVNSQVKLLQPQKRISHTATFINDKLYILGGESLSTDPTIEEITQNEFFYLDCSESFNTMNLTWNFLSNIGIPSRWAAASVKGGINNYTLFLYGGFSSLKNDLNLVYTYDTQNSSWNIPNINEYNITNKRSLGAIIDYNGKMYLFGGTSDELGVSNDMIILDTINLAFTIGSFINAPSARFYYGSTLLPNQNIIYFGGNDGINILGLDVVYFYDTINDIWSTNVVSGLIPSNRYLFSTVLGLDGRGVIIFGGFDVTYTDSLYVLDTISLTWYMPNVTGQLPANRYNHKANVIGNFMVVSFGYGYEQGKESDILLLNMTNNEEYQWSIIFEPFNNIIPSSSISLTPTMTQTNSPVSSQQQSDRITSTSTSILVAAIIACILIFLGCLLL